MVKNLPAMQENPGFIPREGNGYPLQYSCLGNPMDRGAWWATVHGGRKELDTTEQSSMCTYVACGTLVPQPGIEPGPLAVEAQSLNHWTNKEIPVNLCFSSVLNEKCPFTIEYSKMRMQRTG